MVTEASKRLGLALLVTAALTFRDHPAWSEDSNQTRYYLGIRYGEKIPGLSKATDISGGSIGVNLGRTLGVELALDAYELKVSSLSELSVIGVIPQARLRYPLLGDRLTPYLVGGAGLAVSQPNDARAPVTWPGGKTRVHAMGTVGGGVDYFFADNLSVGLEGKYLASGDVSYKTSDTAGSVGLSTGLFTVGLRIYYPQLHPAEAAEAAADATARVYLDLRTGVAPLLHSEPFDGVRASPEQPVFGSDLAPLFGGSVGADFGRFASLELSIENYELSLALPGVGGIGEYAVFPITVQPRFRYPLLSGRLEPYGLGGVGAEIGQINDKSATGRTLDISAHDITVVGDFAVGLDYALMSNVAIGCEAKYVISRGHTLQINDVKLRGNLDSLFLSFGLRVVLADI